MTLLQAESSPQFVSEESEPQVSRPRKAGWDRPKRVFVLLLLVWIFSAADLGFTLWAHRFTPFVEGNPIAAKLLIGVPRDVHGGFVNYSPLILLKLVTVTVGTIIIWPLRKFFSAEIGLWVLLLAFLGLMVLWSNYTGQLMRERQWMQAPVPNDQSADNADLADLDN